MKSSFLVFLIVILLQVHSVFGQRNFYKMPYGKLLTEQQFRSIFDQKSKKTSEQYIIVPIIYHKIFKKDTVINYTLLMKKKYETKDKIIKFEPIFRQDPLFLLLDKKLPDFSLVDLKNKSFSSSQLCGKPTLINFWGLHCGSCIREFPLLDSLTEIYGNKMNFISITKDNDNANQLTIFFQKRPSHFNHLQDGGAYMKKLNVDGIPTNIFIDKNGIIRDIQPGLPVDGFKSIIEKLIK